MFVLLRLLLVDIKSDGSQKTLTQQFCSAELAEGMRNQLICLSVINIFLSITAFLGNILIVVVLYIKESSLHPHSRLSFGNLAYHYGASCSYLLDVLGEQTFENLSLCIIHGYLSRLCVRWSGVSLPTLSAISVDRLLGLLLGLRYKQIATLKRTCVTVIVVWISLFSLQLRSCGIPF